MVMMYRKCIFDIDKEEIYSSAWIPWLWKSAWFMNSDEIVLRSNSMKLRLSNSQIESTTYREMGRTSGKLLIDLKDRTSPINFGVIDSTNWAELKNKYSQRVKSNDAAT